jgi:hypothetical protein
MDKMLLMQREEEVDRDVRQESDVSQTHCMKLMLWLGHGGGHNAPCKCSLCHPGPTSAGGAAVVRISFCYQHTNL